METQMLTTSSPAPAVSKPKVSHNLFGFGEICRNCRMHATQCECTVKEKLTFRQELFVRCYTQNEELAGNATLSYAYAYGHDLENADRTRETYEDDLGVHTIPGTSAYDRIYDNCSANASRLLRNDKITRFINQYFNELLTDERVDRELAWMITRGDGATKMAAIREYNALKQRITKKVEVNTKGSAIVLNDEQKKKLDLVLGIS
jgi:hypothetical protein